jgi:N-methylhydantoinase A
MKRVVIPPRPGVFSALGLLFSDIEHEVTQTLFCRVSDMKSEDLEAAYAKIERELRRLFAEEGLGADGLVVRRFADLRYCDQAYELTVPFDEAGKRLPNLDRIVDAFGAEHERNYGHRSDVDPVEFVNIRVIGRAAVSGYGSYDPVAAMGKGSDNGQKRSKEREAYFGPEFGLLRTPIAARHDLLGRSIDGPLIIEEYDATCVIPPSCNATVDRWGNIDINLED